VQWFRNWSYHRVRILRCPLCQPSSLPLPILTTNVASVAGVSTTSAILTIRSKRRPCASPASACFLDRLTTVNRLTRLSLGVSSQKRKSVPVFEQGTHVRTIERCLNRPSSVTRLSRGRGTRSLPHNRRNAKILDAVDLEKHWARLGASRGQENVPPLSGVNNQLSAEDSRIHVSAERGWSKHRMPLTVLPLGAQRGRRTVCATDDISFGLLCQLGECRDLSVLASIRGDTGPPRQAPSREVGDRAPASSETSCTSRGVSARRQRVFRPTLLR